MKIVVIEDEIRIREGLSRLIEKLDQEYEVVGTAENGQEGYELVCKVNPEVIIADIKMPVMDGLEMLTALYRDGCTSKAVILSAYSEFDYARQALRLGVKEYLLKPIVVSDISEALHHVKEEIRQESARDILVADNLGQVFAGLLWGNMKADAMMEKLLEDRYKIPCKSRYAELCLHLGEHYRENLASAKREMESLLKTRKQLSYVALEEEREHMLVFLLYGYSDSQSLERWLQQEILRVRSRKYEGIGWNGDLLLEDLREGCEQVCRYMEWNISLGDDVLISYPKVTSIQTSPCIYPIEIENQMKIHICASNMQAVEKDFSEFADYFHKDKLYEPKEIKECYVRFLWAMMNVSKETGLLDYEKLEQQTLLEQIMGAKTREELSRAVSTLTDIVGKTETEDSVHLTVKRAQSLIREFYQSGITLEEIAAKLNITPEYLGTRFHKELGVNFSTYIKNFRMAKAKELLIGTQMKLYEIAEKVGYSDPKYFSRVFKESTGQLPGDYRKTHK
ncbi:MAG: response regulator [Eubacteriales bacterium]|nr:response regulator [Eubacteriales bacterium]